MKPEIYISVAYGMRGFFAVMYDRESGPINTSDFSGTFNEAESDAKSWAEAENIKYIPPKK